MRRFVLILLAASLMGMGFMAKPEAGKSPAEDIRVQLKDKMMITTQLSHFSCESKTSLSGTKGLGTLTVHFRDLRRIKFFEDTTNIARADLTYRNGHELTLRVKDYLRCKGKSEEGSLLILIRDIKSIDFADPSTSSPPVSSE